MKYLIFCVSVFSLFVSPVDCFSQIPAEGLVGYYMLDGNTIDSGPLGNDGVIEVAAGGIIEPTTNRFGEAGKAMMFSEGSISLGNPPALQFANSVSVAFWVNTTFVDRWGALIAKWDNATNSGFFLGLNPTGNVIRLNLSNMPDPLEGSEIVLKEWMHVAATFDGQNAVLYYDGEVVDMIEHTFPIPQNESDFRIGSQTFDVSNHWGPITTGYDHYGGRLLAIEQEGEPYLILTIGDNGRSELSGDCYDPPSSNPNNFTQDVNFQNGKIHRFKMDGSIPSTNPIPNNSFYTRGHRNPQGLMYNPLSETLYCIEHGDDTDDEINVLKKGMNYGWKDVRGYHDGNLTGESDYVNNYTHNPLIINDALIEPLYSWCTTPATSSTGSNWCTVAPSDGLYYGSAAIPEWENSLLVVTLKRGLTTNREIYQFNLQDNGELEPSTPDNVNPKKFFAEDQDQNGRLRDITVSPDGKVIYLINNGGADASKIIVYTYDSVSNKNQPDLSLKPMLYPNPASDEISFLGLGDLSTIHSVQIINPLGYSQTVELEENGMIDISEFGRGIHFVKINLDNQNFVLLFMKY